MFCCFKCNANMKPIVISICIGLSVLLSSCITARKMEATRFTPDDIKLGMSKNSFVRRFGEPNMQNMYVEDGVFVEELLYVETVYFGYDLRKLNSKFVFKDDKLVRREQCEDQFFRREQELKKLLEEAHDDAED